tara:strand:+ start:1098 stop:1781 length:684 start_codon:yes stop_codon:yes gene_type:complete
MNVTQVMGQLRRYIDEDDATFVTDADLSTWLEMAYNEFREMVCETAPEIYMTQTDITLASSNEYDLANPPGAAIALLGPNAVARLYRLYRVAVSTSSSTPDTYIRAYANPALFSNSSFAWQDGYTLTGSKIKFSARSSGTVRLEYVTDSTVDWSKYGPADNEFIDDLTPFHSMIALLAAQYYQIADAATNAILDKQLVSRRQRLMSYLTQDRLPESSLYVESRPEDW